MHRPRSRPRPIRSLRSRWGGVNRPELRPPPEPGLPLRELELGGVTIRLPFGSVDASDAPIHGYAIPGPIAAFRGVDGLWRGHGYLETIPALVGFTGRMVDDGVELDYRFEQGLRYRVDIRPGPDGCLLLAEQSDLGPRNRWVFDATYGWDAGCACVCSAGGKTAAFLTLPCHYDRPEIHLRQSAVLAAAADQGPEAAVPPAGVAVFAHDPAARDIAGFWTREPAQWQHGERMGFTLYQHRQRPGDLASRHFLGPETKSDGVPNPRAVQMMGTAAFEGH